MKFTRPLLVCGLLATGLAFSGCLFLGQRQHRQSSSVVQFLYPGEDRPFVVPGIPTLRLPLKVGVAFVPPGKPTASGYVADTPFSEVRKTELLRIVVSQFKALPFVQSIEVIPTTYLRPEGGFENLDQLRALMGIDVIALIAYDQAQSTAETPWSFAYWTIVGSYVVPAQKNDTHTLMEAVVYDIESRSLLFRAPGISAVQAHATLVGNAEDLRENSARGYAEATQDLTRNLQFELDAFKARAREEPASVHIEHKPGYTGAGALEAGWVLIFGGIALAGWLRQRR